MTGVGKYAFSGLKCKHLQLERAPVQSTDIPEFTVKTHAFWLSDLKYIGFPRDVTLDASCFDDCRHLRVIAFDTPPLRIISSSRSRMWSHLNITEVIISDMHRVNGDGAFADTRRSFLEYLASLPKLKDIRAPITVRQSIPSEFDEIKKKKFV